MSETWSINYEPEDGGRLTGKLTVDDTLVAVGIPAGRFKDRDTRAIWLGEEPGGGLDQGLHLLETAALSAHIALRHVIGHGPRLHCRFELRPQEGIGLVEKGDPLQGR